MRSLHPDWPESGIRGTLENVEVRADGTVAPWLTLPRHLRILEGLWQHRPSERYALVPVPVLLVPAGDAQTVAAAQAALPRAKTRPFPGADHDIHAQHPVELAEVLHAACDDRFWS